MDGFLVLARCGIDDIPMGLHATHEAAVAHAKAVTQDDAIRIAGTVFRLDTSEVIAVDVVHFRAGVPIGGESHCTFGD